jgi:hypothetical protein
MNLSRSRRGAAALVAALLTVAMALPALAAEKRSLTYSTRFGPVLSRTSAAPGDRPNHEIVQTVREDMTSSSNPDWDGVPLLNYSQSDLVSGSGSVSGYAVRTHRNGDKTFYRFSGKIDAAAEGSTGNGTVELIGGTGRFSGAKGTGTWRSEKGGATITMEVEY